MTLKIRWSLQAENSRPDSEEFEFGARNFSYPIALQLEFLDSIVEETTNKCHRLRDPEDSFRDHFEANTLVLP